MQPEKKCVMAKELMAAASQMKFVNVAVVFRLEVRAFYVQEQRIANRKNQRPNHKLVMFK